MNKILCGALSILDSALIGLTLCGIMEIVYILHGAIIAWIMYIMIVIACITFDKLFKLGLKSENDICDGEKSLSTNLKPMKTQTMIRLI